MFFIKFNWLKSNVLLCFVFLLFSVAVSAQQSGTRIRNFDVQHYVIRTSFDRSAKTVFGETTVRLKPLTTTFDAFYLDAAGMQIESVSLETNGKPLKFAADANRLNITLDKSYSTNDEISVRVKYKIVKPKLGVYFVSGEVFGSYKRPAQIWTQGEPEENHYWFPGYDSPDDKATSEQYITVNLDEKAIANGKLLEVKKNGKTQTYHYKMDVPHSTYLVSFVIGKYKQVTEKYKNVPLGFYVYEGTDFIVPRAFGKTSTMMKTFGKLLNYEFPFEKYDQTVVGKFNFGGMENITATTLADTEIYAATNSKSRDAENLVSHELAHSWFGNLVTCKNWSNLWLNEGFATFMESVFIENQYGREEYLKEMKTNANAYFGEESVGIRHPLQNPRALPNILLFDSTTYKKGAVVINMLREQVGDEMFWKSINNYLNKHKYQNVESKDLQTAFEQTSGQNL
ncbi:MAG: M1 family metallopeptidase, partial [Pyrinomonadaceae bacterium]|nr:M1 family metallopeptidase [Pyrinomonadaceae bacterium]